MSDSPRFRLRHLFGNASIKRQLYMLYLIAMVAPIALVGIFLVFNTSRLLTNYHRDLLDSDNKRVKNILFEITTQIYNISENISFDQEIQRLLPKEFASRESYRESVDNVTILDNYRNIYMEISEIAVYTDNPTIGGYKQFTQVTQETEQTDWYRRAISQSGVFWTALEREDEYQNRYWNLCLVRKIPLVNSPYHAVLVIRISDDYLRTSIDSSEYLNMVSVDQGNIFYSSARELYGTPQMVEIDYQQPYFQYAGMLVVDRTKCFAEVTTLHTYQSESMIYICTLNSHGYDNIQSILWICYMIIGVAILIPGLMIHYFTNYFAERVRILRQEMHKASNQDYELIASFQGNDELSEAFADLKTLVSTIRAQEAEIYQTQISQQELNNEQQAMEFKMLSSQINPHFLYNTLETIRMKAFTAGDREVATAIKLLGKSMRYVLENTGSKLTTLNRELEHVDVYLKIQKLRFVDKFDSVVEMDDRIDSEKISILPLLLQPIVENAILHGLEERESGGRIRIAIYPVTEGEDLLHIDVVDNGSGMTGEALANLREHIETRDMSRSKSIGLYNINQRIKLYYGAEYRVEVYSKLEQGTTVRISLPMEKCRL